MNIVATVVLHASGILPVAITLTKPESMVISILAAFKHISQNDERVKPNFNRIIKYPQKLNPISIHRLTRKYRVHHQCLDFQGRIDCFGRGGPA
jgi:hypothetical protein